MTRPTIVMIVTRQWDEMPCLECGAEDVVIIESKQQIEGLCKAFGENVTFVYHVETVERVVEQTPARP